MCVRVTSPFCESGFGCTPLSSNESDEGNNSGVKETPKGWNNTKPYKDTLEISQFFSFYRMIAIFDVRQGSAKFYSPYKVLQSVQILNDHPQ